MGGVCDIRIGINVIAKHIPGCGCAGSHGGERMADSPRMVAGSQDTKKSGKRFERMDSTSWMVLWCLKQISSRPSSLSLQSPPLLAVSASVSLSNPVSLFSGSSVLRGLH